MSPAVAGENQVAVAVVGSDAQPRPALTVQAQARSLDMAMQGVPLALLPRGGGVYSVTTGALSMAGVWRVTVDAGAAHATFDVTVDPPGGTAACTYGFDAGLQAHLSDLHGLTTVIATAAGAPGTALVGTDHGAWLTADHGGSWRLLQIGRGQAVAGVAIQSAGRTWYVATADGLWVSSAGGQRWRPATVPPGQTITTLLASPWRAGALWVATAGGIWQSLDRAAHWRRLTQDPRTQAVSGLAADPGVQGRLFAGSADGILASRDGGRTWGLVGPAAKLAYGFALVSAQPGTVWASAMDQGIWVTRDGGEQWTEADAGLPNPGGMGIAASAGCRDLIVGTMGGGVARSGDHGATWQTVGCPAAIVTDVAAADGSVVWVGEGVVRLSPLG